MWGGRGWGKYMRALLWRNGTRLLPASFSFLRWLRNLRPGGGLVLNTVQWSQRETHSLIKTLAHPGVTYKNWQFSNLSSCGLRLLEAESETHKLRWNDLGVTPGGDKLKSITKDYYTSLVIFILDKFSWKWERESLKNRNKGVSESQPLTNILARFMHNTYGAHNCKYLANWRIYTKMARLGFLWYIKIHIFCTHN